MRYNTIIPYIKELVNIFQLNPLRAYLISSGLLLAIFLVWFSNVSLLPFERVADFLAFIFIAFLFALYRPGWMFLFFIATIPLEIVNVAPANFPIELRPYQLFGVLSIFSFAILHLVKRVGFRLPKWFWVDAALLLFAVSGFFSALFASAKTIAFKQSLVAFSFVGLYLLVRVYVQSVSDLKRIWPFIISTFTVVAIYGIWQNVRFSMGSESFSVMPGRPNATFPEADWLGAYLVIVLAVVYAMIHGLLRQDIFRPEAQILKTETRINKTYFLLNHVFLTISFITLLLTVARSAWLGAAVVTIGFLKIVAFDGSWKITEWNWKRARNVFASTLACFVVAILLVKIFSLSNFEFLNRAQSTASGMQKITISCENENSGVPKTIVDTSELSAYGCRHINIEEIDSEEKSGKSVLEVLRPDPNVKIRSLIYEKSWEEIKRNPLQGIGWGNIGNILGKDEKGNYLNSSNIFLEVWLGSGLVGLLAFVSVLIYILLTSIKMYLKNKEDGEILVAIILGFVAVLIPNIFNAGIFLGYLWVYLGIAVSLLQYYKKHEDRN